MQLRVQRPFANGFNFLLAYNYNQERTQEFFNKEETFVQQFRWEDGTRPRHRMTLASTYEFPFGRGRRFLSQMHPVADAVLGGWTTSGIFWYYAGNRLRFGQMDLVGEPAIDNPDKWGLMFNPSAFRFNANAGFEVRTQSEVLPGRAGSGLQGRRFQPRQVLPDQRARPVGVQDGGVQPDQHLLRRRSESERDQLRIRPRDGDGCRHARARAAVQLPDSLLKRRQETSPLSTKDQIDGKLRELKGRVKEQAGKATDNPKLTAKGKTEKLAGKVQQKIGQIEKVLGADGAGLRASSRFWFSLAR